MKKLDCFDFSCLGDNFPCFSDCNNLLVNVLMLKIINDKIKENDLIFDKETENKIYELKQNFQHIFDTICNDFITKYESIIAEYNTK